jgi:hypothetical protein
MKTRNILGLMITAMFVMFGVTTAQSQAVVHNKAYYDAITYQWTDANGVSHENAITEEATDPYQIVALLKKVYCDPNIPGPKYSAYDKDGNRERPVYYGAVGGGWNISANDVTPPYEEGYTILMVALNNHITTYGGDTPQGSGWSSSTYNSNFFTNANDLINYINNNIAAVQLLTDGLRVGSGMMSGTTFNISGEYNRFFVLGKGQARQKDSWVTNYENNNNVIAGEAVPFKFMFEEFSPTSGREGSQITDFYSKMVGGKLYPVIHDCMSVIDKEHDFSMAGKNGTEYKSMTGMNIFIPDYRLMYWERDTSWTTGWLFPTTHNGVYDGRTQNPYKTVDGQEFADPRYVTANFAAYNQDYAPRVGIYLVNLEAAAEPTATEHVYNVVLDWTSSLDDLASEDVPQTYILYLVLTDEDGNEVHQEIVTTSENSYTYEVPQDEHSYTLTYIVFAKPSDGDHDMFVAWSNQASVVIPGWYDFLYLALNHYESDYRATEELNYYRNFLNVMNDDAVNALTPARVQDGENAFTLYRMDAADLDVMVPVAQLTLTANNGVRYEITYENQEPLADYNVPITLNGNLNVGAGEAIDLSPITFVDQFTAITANNDHPVRYAYVLVLNDNSKSTNTVEVPVFKTSSTIDGFYTLDEIMGDVDHSLTPGVKNANVEVTLAPNPAVYYYTLERGSNVAPNEAISKLQRRTDGTYLEMLNVLPQYYNTVVNPGIVDRLDNNIITGVPTDYMSYQPVIWTFGEDRVKADGENSYGSPIWKTGVASTEVQATGVHTEGETGVWKDENNESCWIYYPTFSVYGYVPEDASVTYEPFMFRVWRDCEDIRGYYFGENGKPVNDPAADRSPSKLIFEQLTTEDGIENEGGEWDVNPYGFGAKQDAKIQFRVRFYYKKSGVNNMRGEEAAPLYYVVENILDWTEITTSVHELNVAGVESVTYINAQGVMSNKPFDGMNIVITRYSDGSTKTTKMVR